MEDVLTKNAVVVARDLIGWRLYVREQDGSLTGGTIMETEAYDQSDAASHSFKGKTPRNEIMFGPAGQIYVYFTYGMHWCVNIVTGKEGHGEAVLIRFILPEKGIEIMNQRRGNRPQNELTNGPAKICQALAITGADNGTILGQSRFLLEPPVRQYKKLATKRIGISRDSHRLWRFVAAESA